MIVSQILKTKAMDGVLTLTSDASVSDAASIMSTKRIGTIVISDDGGETAAGILSERDIVRELGKRGPSCMSNEVGEMMTRKLVTCGPSDTSDAVLAKMTEGRFRHMPVTEDGKLIGLISIGDAVKARLAELAMERVATLTPGNKSGRMRWASISDAYNEESLQVPTRLPIGLLLALARAPASASTESGWPPRC